MKKIPCYLFLDGLCISFSKQIQQCTAEIMGVTVGVSQLISYGSQEQVTT